MQNKRNIAGVFNTGDEVYILDDYTPVKTNIEYFYDDTYSDNDDYMTTWVKTTNGHHHLDEIFKDEQDAERRIQSKKDSYDRWSTSRF
jgi:hypothetical protein